MEKTHVKTITTTYGASRVEKFNATKCEGKKPEWKCKKDLEQCSRKITPHQVLTVMGSKYQLITDNCKHAAKKALKLLRGQIEYLIENARNTNEADHQRDEAEDDYEDEKDEISSGYGKDEVYDACRTNLASCPYEDDEGFCEEDSDADEPQSDRGKIEL